MHQNKLLIIGRTPPPIGGVSVHVLRLLNHLKKSSIPFEFKTLDFRNLLFFPFFSNRFICIHIHSSNPYIRLYIIFMAKILNKKSIVTIHGNLGRFSSKLKNYVDTLTIKISDKPILLNDKSIHLAKDINKKSELISAFLPPEIENEELEKSHIDNINNLKEKYKYLFCTNAYNLTFDKNNNEIYGIFELIEIFKQNLKYGFVFSDPSGVYSREILNRKIIISENIYIIQGLHSFYKVMNLCDASIRNTSTDGDSLSVKESLFLGKWTFATDVVSRPNGTILYKRGSFKTILSTFNYSAQFSKDSFIENGFDELSKLYNKYLNSID